MIKIVAEVIGIIGIICSILSFQCEQRKRVMLFQVMASFMFTTQLFLVGAVTGACMDLINFVRSLFFSIDREWAKSKWWLVLFMAILICAGIVTWKDAYSILPIIGSLLSTVALWMKTSKNIRLISLFSGPCWLVYNIVNGAYSAAVNELIAMTSIVIGMLRYDVRKKDAVKEQL